MRIMKPTIVELSRHLTSLKPDIEEYVNGDDPDDLPGIDITLGCSDNGWGVQTGDNSFMGNAYGHRFWGVGRLFRRSNCRELARELIEQCLELAAY